jgi:hypothetical protein
MQQLVTQLGRKEERELKQLYLLSTLPFRSDTIPYSYTCCIVYGGCLVCVPATLYD